MKVRESASSIYDPEIVPLEYRAAIIETYVQALRVVFLMTVVFVLLNAIAGAMLREKMLYNKIDRLPDEDELVSDADNVNEAGGT
jgi:hypothetical protein